MGSVIFPDARWKFFLTASVDERAKRRLGQLNATGEGVSLGGLREGLVQRDKKDTSRLVAPLVPARTAVTVDTTFRTAAQTVQHLAAIVDDQEG